MLQFAQEKDLYICNTKYPAKPSRKYTWTAPNGVSRNMIDFVMIRNKWRNSVHQCRSFPSADICSDHELVLCNIGIRFSVQHQHHRKALVGRWDIRQLKDQQTEYMYSSKVKEAVKKFAKGSQTDINMAAEQVSALIRQAAEEVLKPSTRPKKPWLSPETMHLVSEKRLAKGQRHHNAANMQKYRDLSKQVKNAAKKDKENWIHEQCQQIEKYHNDGKMREAYKLIKTLTSGLKSRTNAIRSKDGKLLTGQEDILSRWTEYAQELYKDGGSYDQTVIAELRHRTARPEDDFKEDNVLREEVQKAVDRLKNNKSPGVDGIQAELMKAGGESTVDAIHRLCNMVWDQERWPTEWTSSVLVTIAKKGDNTHCTNYTLCFKKKTGPLQHVVITSPKQIVHR